MKKVLMDLSKYLGVKGLRGVAHYYGVPESRIYSWTKKGRIANPRLILSRNPELNEEWVTTGKGPMLADKAMGRRQRRTPPQADKIVDIEVFEMTTEKPQKGNLPDLLKQVMAISDAGGEAKAILEAQVRALTQSLEKEREQKLLIAELTQIRASMDAMMAMLNRVLSPAAKTAVATNVNTVDASGQDENSNWE